MKTKFQYYAGDIKKVGPLGYVTLKQLIQSTETPKPHVLDIIKDIQKGDKSRKIELYAFTPCVVVQSKRAYSSIDHFTGLLVLDFDHIENAIELRDHLFETYDFIITAWISPSGKGVKCIIRIPGCTTVEQFKEYYWGVADKMMEYDGFDTTGQNPVLPLFLGYDTNILWRTDATMWKGKGVNPRAFKPTDVSNITRVEPTELHKRRIEGIIKSMMSKATNQGHQTVRSSSLILGGYVASGYMEYYEAVQLIYFLIETNQYLQKGVAGYKKTAFFFINQGQMSPLKLT